MQSKCEQVILCCFLTYNKNFKLTVLASGQLQLYQTKTRQLCKDYIFGIHNHESRWDYSKDYTDGKQLRTKPALTITQRGLSFKRCQKTTHVMSDSLWPHGLGPTRLLCPWNFPGKNTGGGYLFLLQGSFPTQGSNSRLLSILHWKVNFLPLALPWEAQKTRVVVVQSFSCVQLFVTPWTAAHQPSLSFTISRSLLKLMANESVMPSNQLIFCHTLLLLPSIFPSIRVFSNQSALLLRWPKYGEACK